MKRFISVVFAFVMVLSLVIPAFAADRYPSSYSSVEMGRVTPVKNQGNSHNCWAFAAISCLETNAIVKGYETCPDFSEAHLVWAVFTASGSEGDINCEEYKIPDGSPYLTGGNDEDAAVVLSSGCGLNDEEDYPFYPYDLGKMGNYSPEDYFACNGYAIDEAIELKNDTNTVKQWVTEQGSVTASYYSCTTDDSYRKQTGLCACFNGPECTKKTNHEVTIVGWNDKYSKENFNREPSSDGAWLCKNSWGSGWGENGYFWLSYEEPTLRDICAFTIKKTDYDNIYTYNGVSYSGFFRGHGQYSIANVFEIKSNETAVSVLFKIPDGVDVNIRIARLNDDFTDPSDGTVIYDQPFDCSYCGSVSADLPPLSFTPGYYAVIIDMKGENFKLYVEWGAPESTVYTASPRQSYRDYGYGWQDSYEWGNFYINLYTVSDDNPADREPVTPPDDNPPADGGTVPGSDPSAFPSGEQEPVRSSGFFAGLLAFLTRFREIFALLIPAIGKAV